MQSAVATDPSAADLLPGASNVDDAAPIRVLLVDDHAVVRMGLRAFFDLLDDIDVVGEASDGSEGVAMARRLTPDVVLMDLLMPRMSGLDAAQALLATQPDVRVIVLTGSLNMAAARDAQTLGLAGFLLKGDDIDSLADCIRAVAAGGTAWNPAADRRIG
jgi:NarL family two-component system response regulator LiaR